MRPSPCVVAGSGTKPDPADGIREVDPVMAVGSVLSSVAGEKPVRSCSLKDSALFRACGACFSEPLGFG